MKRLAKLIIPAWPAMIAAILFSVLTLASNICLMGISAFLIATAALQPPIGAISTAVVGVRFFGIARAVFRYAERYLAHAATFSLLSKLRVKFYRAIEPLAPAGLGMHRSGDLLSRMAADVDCLQFFYIRVIAPSVAALMILIGLAYWLSRYSEKFSLLLLAGFLIAGVLVPFFLKNIAGGAQDESGKAKGQLTALIIDSIQGSAELIVAGQINAQTNKVMAAAKKLNALQKTAASATAAAESLNGFAAYFTAWLVLIIAVPMLRDGLISGVDLAVLMLVVENSFEAVQPLAMLHVHIRASCQAAERLFSVIDARPVLKAGGNNIISDNFTIEFKNVDFAYSDNDIVLKGVSFKVKDGQRVAIVGESGMGKSSIIALLLRFWDCQSGTITLGGKVLEEFHPDSLRRLFSVVPQSAYIFNASIKDNILLAKPNASQHEFDEVIKKAALQKFINELPDKADTPIGENGRGLSGGQRQRIAIARALLKDAPILVLDEPTIGLDSVTEREIMADIKAAMAGRTTILVTHRLLGLEGMDQIIVLDNGKITEQGTYSALLQKQGLFYKMWQQQKRLLE